MKVRFTLDQIKAFERIVELGSFNAAARELNLAQPSVSQRIRELEAALEAPLFIRRGPKISLTIDGRALLDYARRMLQVERDIIGRFENRDPLRGMLRFGGTYTFGHVCMVELLRQLERRHRQLQISFVVGNSGTLGKMLENHELDIAVVAEPDVAEHIEKIPVGRNDLSWLASPRVRLPQGEVTPQQLAVENVMLVPPPNKVHRTVMRWFGAAYAEPLHVNYCNNLAVLIVAMLEGAVVGVAPSRIVQDELARGLLRRIDTRPALPSHRAYICYQSGTLGPGIEVLVALTRQIIAEKELYLPV